MKNFVIIVGVLILIAAGSLLYFLSSDSDYAATEPETTAAVDAGAEVEVREPVVEEVEETEVVDETKTVIGQSADGTDITAYHYGSGDTEVLFIGGVHSGFAPATIAVAKELMTALDREEIEVPENLKVTVIPNLNPDAPASVNQVAGRLNSNDVDLNRNFDCQWQADGTWRDQSVSGGSAPFSEPEAAALRDYVAARGIDAAVVYYSAAGGVFASNCGGSKLSDSIALTNTYADAAGYTAHEDFDFYEVTGDMVNWMAGEDIPAISVLLTDYTGSEWSKNMKGIEAVLASLSE